MHKSNRSDVLADRRRSSAKTASGDEPEPVKVLLVLGEYDKVLDPASEYARSSVHRRYDTVEVVDPDGNLSPRNLKHTSDRPVGFDILDMRQPRVDVTTLWEVCVTAPQEDSHGPELDIMAAASNAVQAIGVALNLAAREHGDLAWQVEMVRRRGRVGTL